MKIILSILLLYAFVFSKDKKHILSSISYPEVILIDNTAIENCDINCQQNLLNKKKILSFLQINQNIENNNSFYFESLYYQNELRLKSLQEIKVAMILPYKLIGRYALSTTKSTLSYLLFQNENFHLKTFLIDNEEKKTLQDILIKIRNEEFLFIIAPLTQTGVESIKSINPQYPSIYIPTYRPDNNEIFSDNIKFGGIDYKEQINILSRLSSQKVALFHDDGALGNALNKTTIDSVHAQNKDIIFDYPIKKRSSSLKHKLKNNITLADNSVILNTPIIKSAMVMSQLTLYENNVSSILSTQINYDPLIFSLTQYNDRKNFILTNVINEKNSFLNDLNTILNNDTNYDWINYSTLLGVDNFYSYFYNKPSLYTKNLIKDNKVFYINQLIQTGYGNFKYYKH